MDDRDVIIVLHNDLDDAVLSVNVTLPTGFEVESLQNFYRDDVLLTNDTTTLVITGVWPEDLAPE
jgi:hypothetical protein